MISVLGSCNIDLVVTVDHLPITGETVLGSSLVHYPGGKGANQAVASSRLGAETSFYGTIGDDEAGQELLQSLRREGVGADCVKPIAGVPTGIASIWVTKNGDNAIAYVSGANRELDASYIDHVFAPLSQAKVVLLQLETPLDAIDYLLRRVEESPRRPIIILDPAPARELAEDMLRRIDILTPNESEIATLTGESGIRKACLHLLKKGVPNVVCKAGGQGAFLSWAGGFQNYPAFDVKEVDSTAAGDAFNAGLAVCISNGTPLKEAVTFANACGALATTREGAQPSLPTYREVQQLLSEQVRGRINF